MRRLWIVVGLVVTLTTVAATYKHGTKWKPHHYPGSRQMVDLAQPDAMIRTSSLAQLPHDLLTVPMAHDVLTEDLLFYYEQSEDRLGLAGAIKRIAYEHKLEWTDRILTSVLDEPAEVAFWRDGKGALRHYAVVMRRNALIKVVQEAASVALKDGQLTTAGEIDTADGKATVLALELNPRRTLLLITRGDRIVVLSDPGLLFDRENNMVPAAQAAITAWLEQDHVLSRQFELDQFKPAAAPSISAPWHTVVVRSSALSLGYSELMPGFKGLRFDFGQSWSTSVWLNNKVLTGLGDSKLWQTVPANPAACVLVPVDWHAVSEVLANATNKPSLKKATSLDALSGSAIACWYGESNLYSPVFIARMTSEIPDRNATLQELASWAIATKGEVSTNNQPALERLFKGKNDTMVWREAGAGGAALAARGQIVAFSPDQKLVDLVLATMARSNPSVADQLAVSATTLAVMTPQRLSAMVERESYAALSGPGDANLLATAQTRLPPHMKALAAYPPYRLDLTDTANTAWRQVEWRSTEVKNEIR